MAVAYTHDIILNLNTKQLNSQLLDFQKDAKVEVKAEMGKKSKELIQVVENLEKINRLAQGNWDKKDILSTLLDVSKKLNSELGKTDKNDNAIAVYQKQLLVLANTLKQTGSQLNTLDIGKLFSGKTFSGRENEINSLVKTFDVLKNKLSDFGDIDAISVGQLIDKNFIRDYINQLEGLSKEFKDKFSLKIKPNIQIGDILIDKFNEEKVEVDVKPIINVENFIGDINQQIKDSGQNIEIEVKPTYNKDTFQNNILTIENNIKDDNIKIGIDIEPKLNDISSFKQQVQSIETQLREAQVSVGVDISLNTESLFESNKPLVVDEAEQLNTVAEATEGVANKQDELKEKIEKTNESIKIQNKWFEYLSILEKDFSTSGKKEANEQLRNATKNLINYRKNPNEYTGRLDKEKLEVAWYKSMQEAKRQGSSQKILSQYDTDINEYNYKDSLNKLNKEYDYRLNLYQRLKEETAEYREELMKLNNVDTTEYLKNEYQKISDYQDNIESLRKSYSVEDNDAFNGMEKSFNEFKQNNAEFINMIKSFNGANYTNAIDEITHALDNYSEREQSWTSARNANIIYEDIGSSTQDIIKFFDEIANGTKKGTENLKLLDNEYVEFTAHMKDGSERTIYGDVIRDFPENEWNSIKNNIESFSHDFIPVDELQINTESAMQKVGEVIQEQLDVIEINVKNKLINLFKLDDVVNSSDGKALRVFDSLYEINGRVIDEKFEFLQKIETDAQQATQAVNQLDNAVDGLSDDGQQTTKKNNLQIPVTIVPDQDSLTTFRQAVINAVNDIPIDFAELTPEKVAQIKQALTTAINDIPISAVPDTSVEKINAFKTQLTTAIKSIDIEIGLLDEVGQQFREKIKTAIGIIDVPIDPKTNKSSEEVSSIVSLVNEERQAVTDATEKEKESFDSLATNIRENVLKAINEKTEAINNEKKIVDKQIGGEITKIKGLADAISTLNKISLDKDNLILNIEKVRDAISTLYNVKTKKLDFSSILKFFNAISKKSGDDTKSFATRIKSIINTLNKLQEVNIPKFTNTKSLDNFSELIKKFPTEKRAQAFAKAAISIKNGFNSLSKVTIANLSKPNNVINIIERLMTKSKELEHLATILNKTSKVRNEAKNIDASANQRDIGKATIELNRQFQSYKNEFDTSNGVVSQATKDSLQAAINGLYKLRDAVGMTEAQIKQIDNTIINTEKNVSGLAEGLNNSNKRIIESIDTRVSNGKFTEEIYNIAKKIGDFSDSDVDIQKIKELRDILEDMADQSKPMDDRIRSLDEYKKKYAELQRTLREYRDRYENDDVFQKEVKSMREARAELEKYKRYSEMYLTSGSGTLATENILNNIRSDYQDINEAIRNGVKLNEEQNQRLKEQNRIVQETMRFQSGDNFLPNRVKLTDQYDYKNRLSEVQEIANKWIDTNSMKVLSPLETADIDGTNITRLTAKVQQYDGSIQNVIFSWNRASGQISNHTAEVGKQVSKITKMLDMIKRKTGEIMAYWIGNFLNPLRLFGVLKQGISIVQEYDDALVELRKVSDETEEALKRFAKTSFDIGDSVGSTGLQIQKSAAEFLRLGESLQDATKHAKEANILFGVSEYESIDEATSAFISMIQAYKEVDSMDIIDKLNIIGNNFAISTEGISTALKDSAAALKVSGNDINESIALITAGNRIAQNPGQVGKGIRTIALRLTGTKEAKDQLKEIDDEFEDINMTTSKLRETIRNATKVESNNFMGIDILDANGNYKSTYDILLSIADIYQEIVDTDKRGGTNNLNLLLETIAGKNRASIAGSILQSAETLKEAYAMASNDAGGSAQVELEKKLDSITAKFTQFTNQVQEFWTGLISSKVVKAFTDIGVQAVKLVNSIGQIQSIIVGIMSALTVKKLGIFGTITDSHGIKKITLFNKTLKETKEIFSDFKSTIQANGGGLGGFFKTFWGDIKSLVSNGNKFTIPFADLKNYQAIREKAENILSVDGSLTGTEAVQKAVTELGYSYQFTERQLGDFVNAQNTAIKSSEDLGNTFKKTSNIGSRFGNAIKSLGSLLGNVFVGLAISFVSTQITKFFGWISDQIHAAEILREEVNGVYEKFNNLNSTYTSHQKTLSDISGRFEELSKGVDAAGNNVSLTTDEFDEYHTIVNQIKDMFPKMIKGYDDQGRAILGVKNNVVELNKELENEKILANDVLIQKREDIQNDWQNKTVGATSGLSLYGASVTETLDLIDQMYTIVNNSLEEIPEDGHIYIESRELTNLIADFAQKYNTTVDTVVDTLMLQSGIALDNLSTNRYMVDDFRDKFDSNIDIQRAYTETKRSEYNSVISQYQELYRAIYENAILKLPDSSILKDNTFAQEILGSVFNNIDENIMVSNWINDIKPSEYVKDFINAFATAFSNGDTEKLTNAYTQLIEGAFVNKVGEVNDKYNALTAYADMNTYRDIIIDALTNGISDEATKQMIISSVDSLFDTYGYAVVAKAAEASKTTKEQITELFNLGDIDEESGEQTKFNAGTWMKLDSVFDEYHINTEKEFTDFFGEINKIVTDPENIGIGLDEALDIWRKQVAEKLEGAKQSLKEFLSDDTNKSQIESYEKDMSRIDEAIDNFNNLDDSEKMGILNEFADKFPEITEDGELTIDMLYKLADAEWEQVDALLEGVKGAEWYREVLKKLRDEAKKTGNTLNSKFAALVKKDNKQDETQLNTRVKGFSNTRKQLALDWYDESLGVEHGADRSLFDLNSQLANIHFDSLEEMLNDDRFKQLREEYENLVDVFANGRIDTDELQSLMEIYNLSAEDVKENAPKIYKELKMIMEAFTSGAGKIGEDWWDEYCKGIKKGYTSNKGAFYDLSKSYTNFIKNGVDALADGIFENNYSDVTPDSLKLSEILKDERFNLAIETRDKINEAYKDGLSESEVTEFMTMFDMSSQDVRDNLPSILEFCNKVVDIFGEAGGESAKEYIRRYTEEQEAEGKTVLNRFNEILGDNFVYDRSRFLFEKEINNRGKAVVKSYDTMSNAEKQAIIKLVDDDGKTFEDAVHAMAEHSTEIVSDEIKNVSDMLADDVFSSAVSEYEELLTILQDGINEEEQTTLLEKYGFIPDSLQIEQIKSSAMNIIETFAYGVDNGIAWLDSRKKQWAEKTKNLSREILLNQVQNSDMDDQLKSWAKYFLTDEELSILLTLDLDEHSSIRDVKNAIEAVKNNLDISGILEIPLIINGGTETTTVGSYYDETISKARTLATVVNSLRQEEGTDGKKYWSDIVGDEATFSQLLKIMPDLSEYMSQYSGDTEQTAAAIAYLEENGQRLYDEFVRNTTGLTELDGATDGARAAFEDMLIVLKQITGLDFKGELKDIGDSLDKIYFDGQGDQARSFADAISDVESEINTLKSAYNDLMSVDIRQDSEEFTSLVNTLIQQFPELIGHTGSIEELRNAVAQLLNEKSDNLILRLIELRDTEGIPDELRGKINALIDSFNMLGNQPFSMDNTMSVLKSVRGELNQLAKFINEVNTTGLHLDMTASDEVYNLYPELLENAKIYSDGTIELDRAVYENFIKTREAELKGDIDARVKELENQNTVLKSKIQYHEQRLNLAKKALATENLYDMEAAIEKIETADTLLEAEQANDAERVKSYNEASRIVAEDKKDLVNYQIEADNTELEHEQDTDIAEVESDDAKTINKMENDQTYAQHNTEMLMGMSENYAQEMTDEVEMSAEASEMKQENEFAVANAAAGVGNDIVRMSGETSEKSQGNALTASEKIQNAAIWIGQKAALAAENWRKIGTNEGATNMGSAIMSGISGAFKTIGGWVQRAATTVSSAAKGELIQATKGEIKSFKDQFQGTFLTSIGDTISALKHSIDVAQVKQAKQDALKNIVAGNIDGVFEKALSISELKNDPSKINEFADSIKGRLESARATLQSGIESDEAIIADLYEQLAKNEYNIELLKANGGIDLQEMAKKLAADNAGKSGGSGGSDHTPSGGSGGGGSDRDAADNANEFSEIIDWIEVKIKRLEEEIARLDKIAGNSFENYFDRAKAIEGNLDNVRKEIEVTRAAYYRYMMEANNIPLDENYRRLVREGAIAIEDIHDEELSNAIKAYTEWLIK